MAVLNPAGPGGLFCGRRVYVGIPICPLRLCLVTPLLDQFSSVFLNSGPLHHIGGINLALISLQLELKYFKKFFSPKRRDTLLRLSVPPATEIPFLDRNTIVSSLCNLSERSCSCLRTYMYVTKQHATDAVFHLFKEQYGRPYRPVHVNTASSSQCLLCFIVL